MRAKRNTYARWPLPRGHVWNIYSESPRCFWCSDSEFAENCSAKGSIAGKGNLVSPTPLSQAHVDGWLLPQACHWEKPKEQAGALRLGWGYRMAWRLLWDSPITPPSWKIHLFWITWLFSSWHHRHKDQAISSNGQKMVLPGLLEEELLAADRGNLRQDWTGHWEEATEVNQPWLKDRIWM